MPRVINFRVSVKASSDISFSASIRRFLDYLSATLVIYINYSARGGGTVAVQIKSYTRSWSDNSIQQITKRINKYFRHFLFTP